MKSYKVIFSPHQGCLSYESYVFYGLAVKTPWPSFFDILASFGVKNVCALFREIE